MELMPGSIAELAAFADSAALRASPGEITNEEKLSARLSQLKQELETLRLSHSEAVAAAIEEHDQRLRDQESHLRQLQAIMLMAADGIFNLDENGCVESFNEAAGRIFGYHREDVIGQPISLLFPECALATDGAAVRSHLLGRMPPDGGSVEIAGRRKSGESFIADLSVSEAAIGPRRILTGIFRDITERKRAVEELRQLHLQNQLILNSAGEGILGVDCAGRLMFANPAASTMLGRPAADLIGLPVHGVLHVTAPAQDSGRDTCPICRHINAGTASGTISHIFWRQDGSSFPVECLVTPIGEADDVNGAVVTFRDVTERRRLEAQLRQAQRLESIGQLAAGVAHEINTPTQYLGDNARFLQESFADLAPLLDRCARLPAAMRAGESAASVLESLCAAIEHSDMEYLLIEIPKAIAQSLEGVGRVARIVRSMKEFSHPSNESFQIVDLNHAIDSTLTVSRNEWKYVAEAETDLAGDLPRVACMPGDINQVLLNLIVNAAHAIAERLGPNAAEKGRIVLRTRRVGDQVEIRVEDNGTGIPLANQRRVFDPFFTTKPVGQGTGQGLSISHSIITERHHGSITFETELGRGTTFVVRLPIEQSHNPGASHAKSNPRRG